MAADLDKLFAALESLSPEEKTQVFVYLEQVLIKQSDGTERFVYRYHKSKRKKPAAGHMSEAEFEQALVEKGILAGLPGEVDPEIYANRKAVSIRGKPLSETIIEERR